MADTMKWRTGGVKVVRTESLDMAMRGPSGTGDASAFDFTGTGGRETWIGTVTLPPNAKTGAHHQDEKLVVNLEVVPIEQPEAAF
jgi:uncharacterized RmlC-like cupin family protein